MRKLSMDELNRMDTSAFKNSDKLPLVVVLDNIRSLSNIGSFFRTADAFRIESIYLCGVTAKPPHREIHKTALGATESVDWKYFSTTNEAIDLLRKEDFKIVSIEQTTKSVQLWDYQPTGKTALIFGNEVEGVADDILALSDFAVEIPQIGTKHSLNVAVCGGIVMWHLFEKITK